MPEREAKLVVTGERPPVVAGEIAGLTRLGGRALRDGGAAAIRDVYLDTPAGALRARGDSLRVRVQNGRPFLTLKGPGRSVGPGVIERDELETPWSPEAYARCLDILATRGISLRPAAPGADPVDALLAAGLSRAQERETHRRLRYADGGAGRPVAELAVDEVTYRLAAGAVGHHEVEIEAKAPAGADFLPLAVTELQARFGSALTPWRHGKLATGLAIERLLASPGGAAMVVDGHLTPAAYPPLAALLSAGSDASPG
ncbi:MAG TPA: CYTH domain-containing protein [Methylomirabilota bacterium]|nr:CYTH domain-containing protein [Methylomirabilota bacterium]